MHLVSVDNAGPCGPGCACETGAKLDPEMFEEGDETTVSSGRFHSLTQFTPSGEWAAGSSVLSFDQGISVGDLREALAYLDESDTVTLTECSGERTWVEFEPAAVFAPAVPARDRDIKTPVMGVIGVALLLFVLSVFRPVITARTPNMAPQRRRAVAGIVKVDQDRVPDLGRRAA